MDSQDDIPSGFGFETQRAATYDSDTILMKRALINEKNAPEILEYKKDLLERFQASVEAEEAFLLDAPRKPEDALMMDIHWISLNRAKYLIRSYLRTRLAKIEAHVMHILMPENGLHELLSNAEQDYAAKYTGIVDEHFHSAVLGRMPGRFDSLVQQMAPEDEGDEGAEEERRFDMVPSPDLDNFVFARPLEDVGQLEIGSDTIELAQSSLYIIRYRPIRGLLGSGVVDLV